MKYALRGQSAANSLYWDSKSLCKIVNPNCIGQLFDQSTDFTSRFGSAHFRYRKEGFATLSLRSIGSEASPLRVSASKMRLELGPYRIASNDAHHTLQTGTGSRVERPDYHAGKRSRAVGRPLSRFQKAMAGHSRYRVPFNSASNGFPFSCSCHSNGPRIPRSAVRPRHPSADPNVGQHSRFCRCFLPKGL